MEYNLTGPFNKPAVHETGLSMNGKLWIGTRDGLARYDGYRFKFFKRNDDASHSLLINFVLVIFEDSQGNLWMGTYGGGRNRFTPKTELFNHFRFDARNPNSLSDDRVKAIFLRPTGVKWGSKMK